MTTYVNTQIEEFHRYAASRLGTYHVQYQNQKPQNQANQIVLGLRTYELANHLGNVLVVISDKKLADDEAHVVSASDYYPFGMTIQERTFQNKEYRFGFQGQETESELFDGNGSFFKYRISDNRLGRFFSVDPLASKYPYYSQYAFSGNRLIDMIELEGLEPVSPIEVDGIDIHQMWPYLNTTPTKHRYQISRIGGNKLTVFFSSKGSSGYGGVAYESGILSPDILKLSEALDGRIRKSTIELNTSLFSIPVKIKIEPSIGLLETPTGLFSKHVAKFDTTYGPEDHATDGWGKVWRHLTWQGIMTLRYGREFAENVGNAFERGTEGMHGDTSNPDHLSFVDILNNEYGRIYAKEFADKGGDISTDEGLIEFLNFTAQKTIEAYNTYYKADIDSGKRTKMDDKFKFEASDPEIQLLLQHNQGANSSQPETYAY